MITGQDVGAFGKILLAFNIDLPENVFGEKHLQQADRPTLRAYGLRGAGQLLSQEKMQWNRDGREAQRRYPGGPAKFTQKAPAGSWFHGGARSSVSQEVLIAES